MIVLMNNHSLRVPRHYETRDGSLAKCLYLQKLYSKKLSLVWTRDETHSFTDNLWIPICLHIRQ